MNQPQPPQGHPQQPMQGQPYPPQYPQQYPPPQSGGNPAKVILIVLGVVVGGVFLVGLLVGVLAVAVVPKLSEAKTKLELKQMEDLNQALLNIPVDNARKRKINRMGDLSGRELWSEMLRKKLIEPGLGNKLVSLQSTTDHPANMSRLDDEDFQLESNQCSYTAPRAERLLSAMSRQGNDRCVLVTWNSRNWNNAGGEKVPVIWSDKDKPEYLTFQQAEREWGITRAEWDDPAGKLFGRKAPFQFTYE